MIIAGLKNIFWIIINYFMFNIKNVKFNVLALKKIKGIPFIKNEGEIIFGNINLNSTYNYNPIGGQTFSTFVTTSTGKIVINDSVGISNSTIFSMSKVEIEKGVLIGGDCKIYDTDFHSINSNNRSMDEDPDIKTSPILIKRNVFIGGSVIILKGVVIGENSVIGAGSVVSKKIPPNEVWAGNPAKYIKDIF